MNAETAGLRAVETVLEPMAPMTIRPALPKTDAKPDAIGVMLAERNKLHGDFHEHARVTQNLKAAMVDSVNWERLDAAKREALEMIQHKIGRILAGDPEYADHWDDIMGYTRLARDRLART